MPAAAGGQTARGTAGRTHCGSAHAQSSPGSHCGLQDSSSKHERLKQTLARQQRYIMHGGETKVGAWLSLLLCTTAADRAVLAAAHTASLGGQLLLQQLCMHQHPSTLLIASVGCVSCTILQAGQLSLLVPLYLLLNYTWGLLALAALLTAREGRGPSIASQQVTAHWTDGQRVCTRTQIHG
jgi:hypothetical protein